MVMVVLLIRAAAFASQSIKSTTVGGYKWKTQNEVEYAISSLQHREVMGLVQTNRAGLGSCELLQQLWLEATKRQQKTMVVDEVTRLEQECFHVKAISQGSQ